MKKILLFLGIFLIISSFVLELVGFEDKVVWETPCVDGRNRIIEGIMCEYKEETFFGKDIMWGYLVLFPINIVGFSLIIGLLYLWLCGRRGR